MDTATNQSDTVSKQSLANRESCNAKVQGAIFQFNQPHQGYLQKVASTREQPLITMGKEISPEQLLSRAQNCFELVTYYHHVLLYFILTHVGRFFSSKGALPKSAKSIYSCSLYIRDSGCRFSTIPAPNSSNTPI